MSHTYYTNTDALDIQYTGSGTAAALSISGKMLTITVTGASDSVSYNLAQGQTQGTISGLQQALAGNGEIYDVLLTPCQGPYGTGCSAYTAKALLAQDLADVSGQDVKSSVYHMELDVTRLTTDEITLSRQWMTTNLTGLPATPVYVYPGGYETTAMQGITEGVPYTGRARSAEGRSGSEGHVRGRIQRAEHYEFWSESFVDGIAAGGFESEDSGAGVERVGVGSAVGNLLALE